MTGQDRGDVSPPLRMGSQRGWTWWGGRKILYDFIIANVHCKSAGTITQIGLHWLGCCVQVHREVAGSFQWWLEGFHFRGPSGGQDFGQDLGTLKVQCLWLKQDVSLHINVLDLWAVYNAAKPFGITSRAQWFIYSPTIPLQCLIWISREQPSPTSCVRRR